MNRGELCGDVGYGWKADIGRAKFSQLGAIWEAAGTVRQNDFAEVLAWERAKRIVVVGSLVLSSIQTLMAALVFGILGSGENDKLVAAGLLLFSGAAIAVALAFRKLEKPSWKHWLVIAVLAAPGVVTIFFR